MAAEKAKHHDPAVRTLEWVKERQKLLTWIGTVVVIAIVGVWFALTYQRNRERAAIQALERARSAAVSGNLPLAASDLSRVISSYGGTLAADEAVILLGRVRLRQAQPELVVQELQTALSAGLADQFLAQGYGLLGTAFDELSDFGQAAQAYERAAQAAWYDFWAAEYANEAARAFAAAGDTSRAMEIYADVIARYEGSPGAAEAEVRLGELAAASSTS